MGNDDDFGIANFRLAVKVMGSGKCQCVPGKACPCKEWLEDKVCDCGVFWDIKETKLTAGQKKILKVIRDNILKQCEIAGVK